MSNDRSIDYLKLLATKFPNQEKTCIEIANLNSILTLPKGTEYFLSDLHGEHESFIHLLHSASGVIRKKIKIIFKDTMSETEILSFAHLIYYPEEETEKIRFTDDNESCEEQKEIIKKLVLVAKEMANKYTKSKVRKSVPKEYTYLIDELLYKDIERDNVKKDFYYDAIINTIVDIKLARRFVICLCKLIQKLAVDSLHIIGDIFDRGARHDLILDELMNFHNVDIEWGNHDIEWMGASLGNETLIINALRIAVRYNCYDMLEDGYGISLRALNDFAARTYADDPCSVFMPKILDENEYDVVRPELTAKLQKALAIIQFKLEGALIRKHPEYEMNDRIMLEKIDYDKGTVDIEGKTYELLDKNFPTVDKRDPLKLSSEERELVNQLKASFTHSIKLREHIKFLYDKGSLYKIVNGNVLYHGIIPLNEDKTFHKYEGFDGKQNYYCKCLMDYFERIIRAAYVDFKQKNFDSDNIDAMYYMWCGKHSPLFGKDKIKTFEMYFLEDKSTHKEKKNYYYDYYQDEQVAINILKEFGLDKTGHIINGHVPVKTKDGESPIKANGRLFIIDGGMSKSYQKSTGIAGYTMIADSRHITIAAHMPIDKQKFNTPMTTDVEELAGGGRVRVRDTDNGKEILKEIEDLEALLKAYRDGIIEEK